MQINCSEQSILKPKGAIYQLPLREERQRPQLVNPPPRVIICDGGSRKNGSPLEAKQVATLKGYERGSRISRKKKCGKIGHKSWEFWPLSSPLRPSGCLAFFCTPAGLRKSHLRQKNVGCATRGDASGFFGSSLADDNCRGKALDRS